MLVDRIVDICAYEIVRLEVLGFHCLCTLEVDPRFEAIAGVDNLDLRLFCNEEIQQKRE